VSAVVKNLRSIDNPPFKYGHLSAFPIPQRVAAITRITEEKNMSICGESLHPNREPITMEFDSINSLKTKKETTEQA
jgi:hypothetical protein